MSEQFQPSRIEDLTAVQMKARLRSIGARFVPERSKPGKPLYWAPSLETWVLAQPTRRPGVFRLGYYPMEQCPCQNG